ncbi:Ww domain-containing oxidoreductase, partial [Globisporangium splendens]
MSDVGKKHAIPTLDVEKFSRFSSATFKADKFYKTIGYGCGSLGHLLSLYARKDSDVSTGLRQISSNIGMARFVLRFTGGFEAYEAWKNGSWCYGDDDAFTKRLVSLQTLSMLVYYPMEHLSYVGFVIKALSAKEKSIAKQTDLTDDERREALATIRSRYV